MVSIEDWETIVGYKHTARLVNYVAYKLAGEDQNADKLISYTRKNRWYRASKEKSIFEAIDRKSSKRSAYHAIKTLSGLFCMIGAVFLFGPTIAHLAGISNSVFTNYLIPIGANGYLITQIAGNSASTVAMNSSENRLFKFIRPKSDQVKVAALEAKGAETEEMAV